MRFLFVLLLFLNGCLGENFALKFAVRGFIASFTVKSSEKHDGNKSQGLEVISAGLARTGSASLQKALNILGYNAYHMAEVLANDHSELWNKVVNTGGKEGVKDVVSAIVHAGYDATTDSPSADFSMQLLEFYPDAKVIYSTRAENRWLASVSQIPSAIYLTTMPPFSLIPRFVRFGQFIRNLHCQQWNGCLMCDGYEVQIDSNVTKSQCLGYRNLHAAKIRSTVPADQLLEFHPSQGWEPLCKFLDKPIPDEPFPHINGGTSLVIARFVFWVVVVLYHACCIYLVFYLIAKLAVPLKRHFQAKSPSALEHK